MSRRKRQPNPSYIWKHGALAIGGVAMLGALSACTTLDSHVIGAVDGGEGGVSNGSDGGGGATTIDRTKLDILVMIDNSGSMEQEQAALAEGMPRMLRALITGDRLGNDVSGDAETLTDNFTPITDIHIGIVTSDMGTAGATIQTCVSQPFGENGVLRDRAGAGAGAGCSANYPSTLAFRAGTNGRDIETNKTVVEFAADFACVAQVGTNGCGFEQQLESSLKALTPASSPLRFLNNSSGNGEGGPNTGLVRSDSTVLVILISDEEDCSFQDSSLVDGSDPVVTNTNINLRCVTYPELLYPVSRYVDGLKALRPGNEESVFFSAIVGVPTDLIPAAGETPNYDVILADDRMQQVQDSDNPNQLRAACQDTGRGRADPARRIVEVVRGFGANGSLQSICQADFSPALDGIISAVTED